MIFRLLLLSIIICPNVYSQTVDDIIKSHIKALGGYEKLRSAVTMERKGVITYIQENYEFPVTIISKQPDMLRIESEMLLEGKNLNMTAGYDGKNYWEMMRTDEGNYMEKKDNSGAEFIFQAKNIFSPLLDYKEKGYIAELIGKKNIEGKEHYILKISTGNSGIYNLYINAESYLIMRNRKTEIQDKKELVNELIIGGYKKIDGICIPHYLENRVNGQTFMITNVKEVKTNIKVNNDIFVTPDKDIKKIDFAAEAEKAAGQVINSTVEAVKIGITIYTAQKAIKDSVINSYPDKLDNAPAGSRASGSNKFFYFVLEGGITESWKKGSSVNEYVAPNGDIFRYDPGKGTFKRIK